MGLVIKLGRGPGRINKCGSGMHHVVVVNLLRYTRRGCECSDNYALGRGRKQLEGMLVVLLVIEICFVWSSAPELCDC